MNFSLETMGVEGILQRWKKKDHPIRKVVLVLGRKLYGEHNLPMGTRMAPVHVDQSIVITMKKGRRLRDSVDELGPVNRRCNS